MSCRPLSGEWQTTLRWLTIDATAAGPVAAASDASAQNLTQLDIEQLMNKKVASVSRSRRTYVESAAAVFVISSAEFRRSGVTLVPQVLRLAPGLHVARISSNRWVLTAAHRIPSRRRRDPCHFWSLLAMLAGAVSGECSELFPWPGRRR